MSENKSTLNLSITSIKLSDELLALENKVHRASKYFEIVGEALNEINNNDLYKERGFKTFETYVETFFDISRDYAYKMIAAFRIMRVLKETTGDTFLTLPRNESQCRPMTLLEDKDIIPVWKRVLESQKRITAALIKEEVDKARGKSVPESTPKESKEDQKEADTGGSDDSESNPTGIPETAPKVDEKGLKLYTEVEVQALKAQLAEAKQAAATAEAKLLAERQSRSIPGGKMAREMIQAGFKAIIKGMSEEQKKEALEIKEALLSM